MLSVAGPARVVIKSNNKYNNNNKYIAKRNSLIKQHFSNFDSTINIFTFTHTCTHTHTHTHIKLSDRDPERQTVYITGYTSPKLSRATAKAANTEKCHSGFFFVQNPNLPLLNQR